MLLEDVNSFGKDDPASGNIKASVLDRTSDGFLSLLTKQLSNMKVLVVRILYVVINLSVYVYVAL